MGGGGFQNEQVAHLRQSLRNRKTARPPLATTADSGDDYSDDENCVTAIVVIVDMVVIAKTEVVVKVLLDGVTLFRGR